MMVVDYGVGNLNFTKRKIYKLKASSTVPSNPKNIREANKIILVGVGCLKRVMSNLLDPLSETALVKETFIKHMSRNAIG